MTTFGCPECGRNWQEGPTRDYTENYLCRKCTEALAKEAGEALAEVQRRIGPSNHAYLCAYNDPEPEPCTCGVEKVGQAIMPVLTKLRAAALIAAEIDRLDRKAAILGLESQPNEQETK